ncbi:MAG: amidohydrolase family protein [Neisseriaceae bacterium]|nr:amidohydrolase family protein [Neisseriaceae bacterium]
MLHAQTTPPVRVDTHAHVFHPDLPMVASRRYTPAYPASVDAYLALLDRHQLSHGILIQPSFLGTDNGYMLAAIAAAWPRLRGVAVIDEQATLANLNLLAQAGIVGIRFNLVGAPLPDLHTPAWQALLSHMATLGWQVALHGNAPQLLPLMPPLLAQGLNVVIDHFGRPQYFDALVQDHAYHQLLEMAEAAGTVWLKLSGLYRISPDPAEQFTFNSTIMPLLLRHLGPERLLWGSDWPHTQHETQVDYAATMAQLFDWLPDEGQRQTVLGASAQALFHL